MQQVATSTLEKPELSESECSVAGHSCAISIHLNSFVWWLETGLAQNQTLQDASDRIKLGGVDEGVCADIEKLLLRCCECRIKLTGLTEFH